MPNFIDIMHKLSELERRLIKIENKIDNIDGRWKGDKNDRGQHFDAQGHGYND